MLHIIHQQLIKSDDSLAQDVIHINPPTLPSTLNSTPLHSTRVYAANENSKRMDFIFSFILCCCCCCCCVWCGSCVYLSNKPLDRSTLRKRDLHFTSLTHAAVGAWANFDVCAPPPQRPLDSFFFFTFRIKIKVFFLLTYLKKKRIWLVNTIQDLIFLIFVLFFYFFMVFEIVGQKQKVVGGDDLLLSISMLMAAATEGSVPRPLSS